MRTALFVSVLVVVPLAGCGGFSAQDTPLSPTTDSATTLPDGLSENGTIDTETLVRGHVEELREANYTARKQIDVETDTGTTLANYTQVSKVGVNRTQAVDTQKYDNKRIDWWYNRNRSAQRVQESNSTEYSVHDNSEYGGVPGLLGGGVLWSLSEYAPNLSITTTEGTVQLHSTTPPEDPVLAFEVTGGLNITNQTTTITMTADGRITQYTAEFTSHPVDNPKATVTGTYDLQFTAYGETTVEQPDWVEDARNASA